MTNLNLDAEEQEILDAFEADEFVSVLNEERRLYLVQAAEETFKKDKRINIRISSRDLIALQRRAAEEGMPYQTLVSSILHKYISGQLQDIGMGKMLSRATQ
jgi:predicted DNA binding CopG/RHH family protein